MNETVSKLPEHSIVILLFVYVLKKYIAADIENALNHCKGKGRKQEISDDDITWVISKACQKPIDYAYSAEF